MRIANAFFDFTVSVTSQGSVHLATNVKLYKETQRTWRSTSTSGQVWTLDMGTTLTAPLPILIYHTNFVQISSIDANTVNSWGAHPFTTGAVTMKKDPEHAIYKHIAYITANFRYIRIVIPTHTPISGDAYFEIGTILIPSSFKEFKLSKEQFEWPVNREVTIYERDVEGETGIIDSVLLSKIPEITFSLSGKMGIDFATKDKLASVLNVPGSGYVMLDFKTAPHEAYIAKRIATYSSSWDRKVASMGFTFRTV